MVYDASAFAATFAWKSTSTQRMGLATASGSPSHLPVTLNCASTGFPEPSNTPKPEVFTYPAFRGNGMPMETGSPVRLTPLRSCSWTTMSSQKAQWNKNTHRMNDSCRVGVIVSPYNKVYL